MGTCVSAVPEEWKDSPCVSASSASGVDDVLRLSSPKRIVLPGTRALALWIHPACGGMATASVVSAQPAQLRRAPRALAASA